MPPRGDVPLLRLEDLAPARDRAWLLRFTRSSVAAMVVLPAVVIWAVGRDEGLVAVLGGLLVMAVPQLLVGIHLLRRLGRAERRYLAALQRAIQARDQVHRLSGLLPICASCKAIRDDEGYWHRVERYLGDHADVTFSHGLCPGCVERLYPDLTDASMRD